MNTVTKQNKYFTRLQQLASNLIITIIYYYYYYLLLLFI